MLVGRRTGENIRKTVMMRIRRRIRGRITRRITVRIRWVIRMNATGKKRKGGQERELEEGLMENAWAAARLPSSQVNHRLFNT